MINGFCLRHFDLERAARDAVHQQDGRDRRNPELLGQGAIMPLYYFHLVSPTERCADDLGNHLPNVEQAYLEVYQAALDISFEMLRLRRDPSHLSFEVTNENGELLFDLPFSEALHPRASSAPPPVG
jgi:hypothetical protein